MGQRKPKRHGGAVRRRGGGGVGSACVGGNDGGRGADNESLRPQSARASTAEEVSNAASTPQPVDSGKVNGDEQAQVATCVPTDGVSQIYRVLNRAFVRAGFERNSPRVGTVEVGELLEELECRQAEHTLRVRFVRGWVSVTAPEGSTILEAVGPAPSSRRQQARASLLAVAAAAPSPAAPSPAETTCTVDLSEVDKSGMDSAYPRTPSVTYRVGARAIVRSGWALNSQRLGTVEPGEVITALQLRQNEAGITRVRFERGWVSEVGRDGSRVLEEAMENYTAPSRELLDAALTEGLLDADGRPKPLGIGGAYTPQQGQYALFSTEGDADRGISSDCRDASTAVQAGKHSVSESMPAVWPTLPTVDTATPALLDPFDSPGAFDAAAGPEVASATDLLPDQPDPDAALQLSNNNVETLERALRESNSKSRIEDYTFANPCFPNPLELALCRREPALVVSALCKVFIAAPSEPLQGDDGHLPLHAACLNSQFWTFPLPCVPTDGTFDDAEDDPTDVQIADQDDAVVAVARVLLGAYPAAAHVKNKDGRLPVHLAARNSPCTALVSMLIDAYPEGASQTDRDGSLPLHLAFCRPMHKPRLAETIGILVKAYPDGVATKDLKNRTPADVGLQEGAPQAALQIIRGPKFQASASQPLLG